MPIFCPPALRSNHLASLAATGLALAPLAGCATGSSASFTQAPLIFAEQSAQNDAVLAVPPALSASGPTTAGIGYVAIGGNAMLPVTALSTLGDVFAATLPPTTHLPVAVSLQVSPAGGASVAASLPAASLAVNTGLPTGQALPAIGASISAGSLATSIAINAGTPAGTPAGSPAGSLGAATTAVVGPVSVALVTTQPILSGVTAPLATPTGSNLLTLSAGNLVRICLLKGCR